MKESFEILPLFSTPLAMTTIEEDTDELYTYDNFESRKSTRDKRILEKYPKTKNILFNKFKEYNEKVLKYNNKRSPITCSNINYINICVLT